ncbi:diacylglycerol O-acyltransferase 1 [Aspergillus pseudoviridinutans]|uniref:Diacylglycerol O-acyltransferase n=1 Tax=Aspergillus pseudoviridinutans TaxID=1517512 RepID=A0A9P3BPU8_9EURO|nr:diacylglycerol O-acyltransferase 1 [Aspergillus pseudoviridinutans]GIJ91581.1 diacylglycerol O-acyltransferase 1 [Aspergillus pseudoviridinutans]
MPDQENIQAGSLQQQPESVLQSSSGEISLSTETQTEQNTSRVNHVQRNNKSRDTVANNTGLSAAGFYSPIKRIDTPAILASLDHSQSRPGYSELRRHSSRSRGIHWAPLNIGLERRMQTFVVLCHTLTIAIFLTFFFFACAIPVFWPLLLPYLVYISLFSSSATSGTLSGRSDFMRSLPIWSLYASYFPACLHRSEALLPTRKYIFGYHPHGIISHGAFAAFATEALGFSRLFPGITNTLLTLDSNFRIPFYREYALAMGLASVSRESCENLLSKGGADGEGMGRAITIVIGGARESLDALPHSLRLVLKCRKGFIKLAIRTGADLVPVLAFGENDLYEQVRSDQHPVIHKFQMLIKHTMGFTIPLFHARGVFNYDVGLMPYRRPLNIVVGRPIQVVQQRDRDKIDESYIDDLHDKYIRELRRLWEQYKDVFAKDRISEIEIVA